MTQKIVLIGSGAIGGALYNILRKKNSLKVELWDKVASKIKNQKSLEMIIPEADAVFLCIPAKAIPEALKEIIPYLNSKTIIISVAKGIEIKSKKFVDELLDHSLPLKQPYALLYGPMLASELKRKICGVGVVAAKNKTTCVSIKKIFENTCLFTECTTDIRGVAVAGVLKNIYALILGIADGLSLKQNIKGWLVSQSLKEMQSLAILFGGKKETILGTAGLGDFITTGFSTNSRNYQVGTMLAKNPYCPISSEGCASLPIVIKKLNGKVGQYTLLNILNKIVTNRVAADRAFLYDLKIK